MSVQKSGHKGVPIVCLDEAVFTFNTFTKKAWYSKYENLRVSQDLRSMKAKALVAAISGDSGLVDYDICSESIDANKFIAFLERLKEHFKDRPFCLFMDNLSVHKTKLVKEILERLEITPIFNVPYSPDFNGIESFFSLIKREYKTMLLQQIIKGEQVD